MRVLVAVQLVIQTLRDVTHLSLTSRRPHCRLSPGLYNVRLSVDYYSNIVLDSFPDKLLLFHPSSY